MSARSDGGFPTRAAEIDLLKEALALEVPVLGICLGAQLLALSADGGVFEGTNGPEIGWSTVSLTEEAADDPILGGLPRELEVLHWHGDTFTLPVGAVHLARSTSYEQQAFRCGRCAWGLQFHVEVDTGAVEEFVRCFGADAFSAGTSPDAIRAVTPDAVAKLEPWRTEIVARFATLVAQWEQDIPD
jgi:GMP synthase-like glutamine amidotransferase